MANINIEFDGRIYTVDEATLLPLASPLEKVLIQQLAGTGAVIRLGDTNYNVDATKLASTRNVLTDHLGNVAGTDSKVTVNDVEYGLSKTKLQGATDKMNETLDGIAIPPKEPSQGLAYKLNYDGVSYSVAGLGICTDTDIIIPAEYAGLPVTTIHHSAFDSCTSLTSVIIPDSVTSISYMAFMRCMGLTSVTIGKGVTHIDREAFNCCYKLVEVINKSDTLTITAGSEDNGYVAYYALEVHDGESKIKTQGDYQFYTHGEINYLLGYVGTATELTLPSDYNGEDYEIYNSIFTENYKITKVTIPDSVTKIGASAFWNCSRLTSVTIGNGVESIGGYAFDSCTRLTSVTIGNGITNIGDEAFSGCDNLTNIYINKEEGSVSGSPWGDNSATVHWNSTGPDAA